MKNVISVDKVIVDYRIKCDMAVSDREELLISQEEYEKAIQFNLNRSKEALHSLLISKLPKKRPDAAKQGDLIPYDGDHRVEMDWLRKCQDAGFNQAIDDVKAVLDELFEVKK